MTYLVISVTLVRGVYNAAGRDGAEWPPAPERLAAAGLAGQAGLPFHEVEKLYELDPPVVIAPGVNRDGTHAAGRGVTMEHWVPTQREKFVMGKSVVTPGARSPLDLRMDNQLKRNGHEGVFVDPTIPVLFVWADVDQTAIDVDKMKHAYARVAYLGRPTSPAVIEVRACEEFPEVGPDRVMLVPQPYGKIRLSVPTPRVLNQRHRQHRANLRIGTSGPLQRPRPAWQGYRVEDPEWAGFQAKRREAWAYAQAQGLTWLEFACRMDETQAAYVQASLEAAGAQRVHVVVDDGVVLGAFADVDHPVTVLTHQGVKAARPKKKVGPRAIDGLARQVSSSTIWTTTIPVVVDMSTLASDVRGVCGVEPLDAVVHEEPLGPSRLWPMGPYQQHVTIWYPEPVAGPLFLNGVVLHPVRTPDDAAEEA